jgi:hypothetical protein
MAIFHLKSTTDLVQLAINDKLIFDFRPPCQL